MNPATNPIFDIFYRFLISKLSIIHFAEWLYHTDTLGEMIGSGWDTTLLGLDYQAPDAEASLRQLIRRIYQDIRPGSETDRLFWQLDVVETARVVLNTPTNFIDSVCRLCSLCKALDHDCWSDVDFSIFCIIADQSDFLPPSAARTYHSPEALARVERAQADLEALYRPDAVQAAYRLIERFELR